MPARFRMQATFEGIPTGDRRTIGVGSLTTRALSLTLIGIAGNRNCIIKAGEGVGHPRNGMINAGVGAADRAAA